MSISKNVKFHQLQTEFHVKTYFSTFRNERKRKKQQNNSLLSFSVGYLLMFRKLKLINIMHFFYLNYKKMAMTVYLVLNLELRQCVNKNDDLSTDAPYFIVNPSNTTTQDVT